MTPSAVKKDRQETEPAADCNRVVVAFVNNMPDAAIRSSERQFRGMLEQAKNVEVAFEGFFCPSVPRTDRARTTFLRPYQDINALWDRKIDGLIVTGAEPQADRVEDEPGWPLFSRLAGWAAENTVSTIWSCLAAHAAVFRLSGISRAPMAQKMSGLYECTRASDHPLTAGLPHRWLTPHSRYNDLPQAELMEKGFQPLLELNEGTRYFHHNARAESVRVFPGAS